MGENKLQLCLQTSIQYKMHALLKDGLSNVPGDSGSNLS